MRGRASATSLLRLVLCAGFLCVAWLLLSPGDAQAAELPRPEAGSLPAGTSVKADTAADADSSSAPAGSRTPPVTRLLASAGTTAQALVPEVASAPVREATRPPAAVAPVTEVVRPVERALRPARDAVRPVVDAVLDLGPAAVPVPTLPGAPAIPGSPTGPAPSTTDSPVANAPAGVDRSPAAASVGATESVAATAVSGNRWSTPENVTPDHGLGSSGVSDPPVSPVRHGGMVPSGGMPGTAPSGSSAGPAGGHGAVADGVLPWSGLGAPAQTGFSTHGDETATCGPTDHPGSRPD